MAVVALIFLLLNLIGSVLNCFQVDFGNGGTACMCSEEYCDFVGPIEAPPEGGYVVYTSNLAGQRFNISYGKFPDVTVKKKKIITKSTKKQHRKKEHRNNKHSKRSNSNDDYVILELKTNETYQEIIGFGGAFTDSTGFNIMGLPQQLQDDILKSYFGVEGIDYNVGRVPIGGTDFSPYSYSYDDGPADPELKNFALKDLDYKYKIPLVKAAQNLSGELLLYGSAWTAPTWMKTNNKTVGGTIKRDMYQPWANYYVKFLEEYDKEGIEFWGVTTGNEPSLALFPLILAGINTVGWTPRQLSQWVAGYFGPTIRSSKFSDIKILGLDDQRPFLLGLWKVLNTNASQYIDGIAVHWYLDQYVNPSILTATHNKYKDKFILSTEACEGSTFYQKGVRLGNWQRGENYAADIIQDLNHWVVGWVDWNMAINMTGGPTYVGNIVDSPIIVDVTNKVFYKNPMYYAMGHFSKFIPRGSVRLGLTSNDKLQTVAFERPDKGVTIAILNKNNSTVPLEIRHKNATLVQLNVTPKSINTVYW